MQPSPFRPDARLWPLAIVAGCLVLALAALAEVCLVAALAHALRPSARLSDPFIAQLLRAQAATGWIGLLCAPLLWHGDRAARGLARAADRGSDAAFLAALFLLCAGGAWAVQEFLFDGIAHVTDAVSHLFGARALAMGRAWFPVPPCPEAFDHEHIVMTLDGRWFTKYTPGHPILLALGLVTGLLPWIVPIASGLSAVFLVLALKPHLGRASARGCGLLFLASPLALLLGGSFMSHTTFMACVLGGVMGLQALLADDRGARPRRWVGALAGFAWGWALITRPQDAAIAGLLAVFGILLARRWGAALRALPFLLAGLAVPLVAVLLWNRSVYGSALALGYGFTNVGFRTPMFQATFGFSGSFTPSKAVAITTWTWYRLNGALLGWPVSLAAIPFALIARPTRFVVIACATCLLYTGVYFFYSYYGAEYEARYYFPMAPALLALAVLGMRRLSDRPAGAALVLWLVLMGTLYAGLQYVPRHLGPRYSRAYEQVSRDVVEAAGRRALGRSVVLMPIEDEAPLQYPAGFQFNDPFLKNDVLFARDVPGAAGCLRAAFPDRRIYRLALDGTACTFVELPDESGR